MRSSSAPIPLCCQGTSLVTVSGHVHATGSGDTRHLGGVMRHGDQTHFNLLHADRCHDRFHGRCRLDGGRYHVRDCHHHFRSPSA